ncbi:hypothetical protein [Nocardioides sp. B-3]|uniref:hypothetical protein n=1 Tax=Nocardioides sp. B-3 TaxID=2895565 RepID=UPI0021528352|nr:hypothetical protein [Nocardioides sp. B-3]UUZ61370.1 hypothetical protein LP418_12795 [Nocardioides sp. B-3]
MIARSRGGRVPVLLAGFVLATAGALPVAVAADDEPQVSPGRDRVRVDAEVPVTGRGLEPETPVTAVVCGNGARRGSLDCGLGSGLEVGVQSDGTFAAPMRMVAPPQPCPCVVVVTGATVAAITTPVRLLGHPVHGGGLGPRARRVAQPEIVVESAELDGGTSLGTWFGGAGEAVLTVTLRNDGTGAGRPLLDLGWGPVGTDPTRFVATPDMSPLEPRDTRTVEIPVRFDAFSNGEQVVAGTVRAGATEMYFRDGVGIRPRGLFGLLSVLLLAAPMALFARFVRRRRRLEDRSEDHPAREVLGVPMVGL